MYVKQVCKRTLPPYHIIVMVRVHIYYFLLTFIPPPTIYKKLNVEIRRSKVEKSLWQHWSLVSATSVKYHTISHSTTLLWCVNMQAEYAYRREFMQTYLNTTRNIPLANYQQLLKSFLRIFTQHNLTFAFQNDMSNTNCINIIMGHCILVGTIYCR